MNTACTCCRHHFIKSITLLLIWPFTLWYLLNILPWTKCCWSVADFPSGVSYCPAASLVSVLAVTWNDLSSLSPPSLLHHTYLYVQFPSPLFAPVLYSCLSFLFYLLSYFFSRGSQWREDGGPGFGHWCGWARWLCQYPWPAGNSTGNTTSQSGPPSWEEVPDNVWARLLYVREWSANGYDIKEDDFRL